MRPMMPAAEALSDTDSWTIFQSGRKRLVNRQAITGSLEQRMQAIESAPNNNALDGRISGLEQWRKAKAGAITDVNTSNMAVEVLGIRVGRASAMDEVGLKVNAILAALRQREIISA